MKSDQKECETELKFRRRIVGEGSNAQPSARSTERLSHEDGGERNLGTACITTSEN